MFIKHALWMRLEIDNEPREYQRNNAVRQEAYLYCSVAIDVGNKVRYEKNRDPNKEQNDKPPKEVHTSRPFLKWRCCHHVC